MVWIAIGFSFVGNVCFSGEYDASVVRGSGLFAGKIRAAEAGLFLSEGGAVVVFDLLWDRSADLLRRPTSDFVARFMRRENILTGQVLETDRPANRTRVRVADTVSFEN